MALRIPLARVLAKPNGVISSGTRAASSAPEKVEVFVDDNKVLVDPGTTVLQVIYFFLLFLIRLSYSEVQEYHCTKLSMTKKNLQYSLCLKMIFFYAVPQKLSCSIHTSDFSFVCYSHFLNTYSAYCN